MTYDPLQVTARCDTWREAIEAGWAMAERETIDIVHAVLGDGYVAEVFDPVQGSGSYWSDETVHVVPSWARIVLQDCKVVPALQEAALRWLARDTSARDALRTVEHLDRSKVTDWLVLTLGHKGLWPPEIAGLWPVEED